MTNDQKSVAIQSATQIVTALIAASASYRNMGDAAKEAAAAAEAYRKIYAAIKESADER